MALNLRIRLYYIQRSAVRLILQGYVATHPEPPLLGCRDLVANAFGRYLPFKLGKAQQHVQCQPSHAGCGVERLGHRYKRRACPIQNVDDLGKIPQRPGEPVILVDNNAINFA